jgi:hypothetical protein
MHDLLAFCDIISREKPNHPHKKKVDKTLLKANKHTICIETGRPGGALFLLLCVPSPTQSPYFSSLLLFPLFKNQR